MLSQWLLKIEFHKQSVQPSGIFNSEWPETKIICNSHNFENGEDIKKFKPETMETHKIDLALAQNKFYQKGGI